MANETRTDQELFEKARLLATDEAKQIFLSEACQGEPLQMERVLRLLRSLHENDKFLEGSPPGLSDLVTVDLPDPAKKLERIGPYRIIRKLGEGGMGLVYLAEQTEPVQRQVALKVIKPGMDSEYVLARFETERQALSMMDHPNIARVFEAGTTIDGRPFFAMEWIQGIPIADYCDANALSLLERLQLFIPICHAVHHAHQKGIIHRDLKPSNILIATFDNRPVPKVIDFGLAKALATPKDQQHVFTMHGQIVGTIEYMSPEQASGDHASIDTRSDIYSLGIILYELLAGAPPFDERRLRDAGWKEMVRIVQEETPPRPSTRISSIDSPANVAALRKTDPRRLSTLLQGELDWIVMKAIEKQSQRRYESILHFADDLTRFLQSEPVLARPPSRFYTFSKFAKRHRVSIATTLLVFGSILIGIIGTTTAMIRAIKSQRAAEMANSESQKQRLIAFENANRARQAAVESETARASEQEQRRRADENSLSLEKALAESQALLYRNQLMVARTEAQWGSPQVAEEAIRLTDEKRRGWEYEYLLGMIHKNREDFDAGYGEIASVSFNDAGSLLAAACEDRKVRIWDVTSNQLLTVLEGHPTHVTCVRFVPNSSKRVISTDTNGNVYDWDIEQGGKPRVLAEGKIRVTGVEVSNDGRRAFFAGGMGTVHEVLLSGKEPPREMFQDYVGQVLTGFALSPDQSLVGVIGSRDLQFENSFASIHELQSGKLVRTIELGDWCGTAFAFSPDGKSIACGSSIQFRFGKSRGIRIYSVETGELIDELSGNANTVASIAFSPDGKYLYGGGALDGSVSTWDLESKQIVGRVVGLGGRTISLSLNNKGLLAGGGFSKVHVWNLLGRPFQQKLEGSDQLFRDAVLNANGTKVLAAVGVPTIIPLSDDKVEVINRGQVVAWNLMSGNSVVIEQQISPITQFVRSPSGRHAASFHFDRSVRLWNLDSNTSREVKRLKDQNTKGAIAFLNEEELLIGAGKSLERMSCADGNVVQTYPVMYEIVGLAADRSGKLVAIETSGDFCVLEIASAKRLCERKFDSWGQRDFCFNSTGSRLIFVTDRGDIECLSISSGETIWKNAIQGAKLGQFTSDDQRLVIANYFNVLILDANDGSTVLSIQNHNDLIQSVFLSFDGKHLLTVGLDNQIVVESLPK